MVGNGFGAQPLHHRIEGVSGSPLECGVGIAVIAYAVHDFGAFTVGGDHAVDGIRIILQVGIHGDRGIDVQVQRMHQPREQRILMPSIMGELHPVEHVRATRHAGT